MYTNGLDTQILRLSDSHTLRLSDSQTLRFSDTQTPCFSGAQILRLSDTQAPCFSGSQILRLSDSFRFSISPRFSHNRQDSQNFRLHVSQNLSVPDSHSVSQILRLPDSETLEACIRTQSDWSLRLSGSQSLRFLKSQAVRSSPESQTPRLNKHAYVQSDWTLRPVSYTHLTLPTILRV